VGSKYLLEEPLGRGATGTVWRSQVRDTGEAVAIKVLKEELAGDPDVVMRFLRERSALVRLRHPHIVRVRDLVVEGDLLALVMDLVDGPDLHRYLRENGHFSPVGAALLTAGVADALAASHADGIVHRDLKPANVLLATLADADGGERMHPMLTDFGIARLADSPGVTRTHEFVGTPAYVAPESAQGRPQTSAVDIYGAGIMLYELATGRPPFQGATALEVLHRHLAEEPRRPGSVPEPLWTVIERCLRKRPEERPSAVSLARALRVVAAGVGVHASPAEAEAALAVAELLRPDPEPATVPDTPSPAAPGAGDAEPTQVLPGGSHPAYDPQAATSVLPRPGGDETPTLPQGPYGGPGGGAGDSGADGRTRVMPPLPEGTPGGGNGDGDGGGEQGPHPWESQLDAARRRNEQTEIYTAPEDDPLRHRPRRADQQPPARRPQPGRPQQPQQRPGQPQQQPGYGTPGGRRPGPYQQPGPRSGQQPPPGYGRQQPPPRYTPQPQPRYEPQPQPRQQPRYEPRPPRAPEPPREPYREREREPRRRSANPTKIPGLGCLKGCLTVVLVLVVLFVLAWYLTPLPHWFDTGRNLWDATDHAVHRFSHWVSSLSSSSEVRPPHRVRGGR
jgi:serine/threonine-protein kinase